MEGSIDLLPISLYDNYQDLISQGLWIESGNLLVPVNIKNIINYQEYINKNEDPWVIDLFYSTSIGLYLDSNK